MTDVQEQAAGSALPTLWWLGYWRAGEHLYWWTKAVSRSASPAGVAAAVRARVSDGAWSTVSFAPSLTAGEGGRAAAGGSEAALLGAGAVSWDDVHPLVGRLTAGLPGSVAEETDTHVRRLQGQLEEIGDTIAGPPDELGPVVQRIAIYTELAALEQREFHASLERAWSGPLVERAANCDLFGRLGMLLFPSVLREYLASFEPTETPATTVVVAPGPDLGQVPWELLTVRDDDTRAVEVAFIQGGLSPASLVNLARPAARDVPDGPALRIIDPTGVSRDPEASPIYPHGVPQSWTTRQRGLDAGVPNAGELPQRPEASGQRGVQPRGCTREKFGALLQERDWARVLFFGHVDSGDALSPTTSALRFNATSPRGEHRHPLRTDDGRLLEEPAGMHALSARVWLHAPDWWPMPRRVAIIACQADDSRYVEQAGLTLAAVNAGARIVTTTRWTCPTDQSVSFVGDVVLPGEGATTAMALAVDTAHGSADPVSVIRAWQCDRLAVWRSARTPQEARRAAPLVWAAPMTYALPDTVR